MRVQARHDDGNQCAAYSDGKVHDFFVTHKCLSLYRLVYEIQDKYNTFLLATATIVMPDRYSAFDLKILLDQGVNGGIIPLIPASGPYRNLPYGVTRATTTLNGATVTAYDAKVVGRTLSAALVDSFLSQGLSGLG